MIAPIAGCCCCCYCIAVAAVAVVAVVVAVVVAADGVVDAAAVVLAVSIRQSRFCFNNSSC